MRADSVGPAHPPALAGLPDYRRSISGHSVSNHLRVGRGSPGCQRVWPVATGFAYPATSPPTPTESSSRRRPTRVVCVTDWSFSFRCSHPALLRRSLRFDTARFFTAQKRTSTASYSCLLRRTGGGCPSRNVPEAITSPAKNPGNGDFPRHFARGTRASTPQRVSRRGQIIFQNFCRTCFSLRFGGVRRVPHFDRLVKCVSLHRCAARFADGFDQGGFSLLLGVNWLRPCERYAPR